VQLTKTRVSETDNDEIKQETRECLGKGKKRKQVSLTFSIYPL